MHNGFPENTVPLTTICKTYNQLYIEKNQLNEDFYKDACNSSAKLLAIDGKNYIALITKSILVGKKNQLLEARDILVQGKYFNIWFLVFLET